MITDIPFGQWLPDQPDYKNPGLTECCNVFPVGSAYEPIPGMVGTGVSVPGGAIGASRVVRPDGSMVMLVGTRSDLFAVSSGTVTASGLAFSITDENAFWTFIPFGRMVWAFCVGQVPHYIPDVTLGVTFLPHPGTAPKASVAGRVGDFVLAGNMEDIDTTVDACRVRWSRFNDPAGDWVDDIATQGGALSLPAQNGPVVAISSGESAVVLQKYGISRMDYTGGVSVFARKEISTGRGCVAPASVVQVAGVTYFLSDDGFYKTDGASIAPISSQRVFSWFLDHVDPVLIARTQGAVDWRSRCIVWSYTPADGDGSYSRQIVYSFEADRWSCAEFEVDWLFDTNIQGMTLEQVSAIYPDLDTMPISLDSGIFKSRGRNFSAIVGGDICDLSGPALEARFSTGEFQPDPGYRSCVNGVAVMAENEDGNCRVALGGRDSLKGEAVRWTSLAKEGPDGFAHPLLDSRYIRARVVIPAGADWRKASGIQGEYFRTGRT